jgi:hypothetical protein
MSDTARWIVIAVTLVVAAAAALLLPTWNEGTPPPVKIETLDAWVHLSGRPGFELLDKQADDDYFFAIYRTDANEVAFCYRWRGEGDAPKTSFAVRDERGNDVQDTGHSGNTTSLNPTGMLPAGGFVDGMVIPIRKDYEGPVLLLFRDDIGRPDTIPGRELYAKTLRWRR